MIHNLSLDELLRMGTIPPQFTDACQKVKAEKDDLENELLELNKQHERVEEQLYFARELIEEFVLILDSSKTLRATRAAFKKAIGNSHFEL